MQLTTLFTDDDAVSPVIGVILMVAITVILAAVIASFVMGLGQNATNQTPTASFTFDYEQIDGNSNAKNWGVVKVTHDGGDPVNHKELYLRGSGFNATSGACGSAVGKDWARDGASGTTCTDSNIGSGDNAGSASKMYTYIQNQYGTAHISAAGKWPSGQTNSEDMVASGMYINIPVSGDYDISVNYQSQEGQSSATLSSDTGPDA